MAITINNAFINEYSDLVRQLAQQETARLRPKVYEVSSGGQSYSFETLAATDAVEKTTRRAVTNYVDDTWESRIAVPKTWNHTMTIEHEDRVQMLVDPQSNYARNQAYAMNRQIDKTIIAAAYGAAAIDGGVGEDLDTAGQVIGDGTAEISFDLITQVQELFMSNEVMPDEAKCMVVSPAQVRKLMQLTENTSSDYVNSQALQKLNATGIAMNWMGFDWVVSNLLDSDVAGTDTYCFATTRRGIGLAINQDTFTRIGEDPAHSYMIQVFSQWTMGAVRVEDAHVVGLHVAD